MAADTSAEAQLKLLRTPLSDWHVAQGVKLVDFAGWAMPVQYESIVAEHQATRTRLALFDISHMGRLRLSSADAAADAEESAAAVMSWLDGIVTRNVRSMRPGQIRYSLITNRRGGILDDVLIYYLRDHDDRPYWSMVVNGSNREAIKGWFAEHGADEAGGGPMVCRDDTPQTAMIAVQGPRALSLLDRLCDVPPSGLKYYEGRSGQVCGQTAVISRTGYTGEDGCELIVAADVAASVWDELLRSGQAEGAVPAGLGARDTLRLEAGMPLYGHELSQDIQPFQAGLGFAVQLDGRDFVGRDALLAARDDPASPRRVGLQLQERRVPREGYPVLADGVPIGTVTSGTFSPTFDCPLAMAYVQPAHAAPGTPVSIDIRGRQHLAQVVKLPFYQRPS